MTALNVVFNELSLEPCSQQENQHLAKEQMTQFVHVLVDLKNMADKKPSLFPKGICFRSEIAWDGILLADEYSFTDWKSNGGRTEVDFFLSLATRTPIYDEQSERENHELFSLQRQAFFEEKEACGLCAAFSLNGIAASLGTEEKWCRSRLEVVIRQLKEDAEYEDKEESIHHAAKVEHIDEIEESFFNQILPEPKIGQELVEKIGIYFSMLLFGQDCLTQIELMGGGKVFSQVFERLQALNQYAENRTDGQFNLQAPEIGNASDESDSTKQDPSLARQRIFRDPEGIERACFFHLKLGQGRRIHFFPMDGEKRIFVGYIGKHLPTSSD
jgi:hypothetical protein